MKRTPFLILLLFMGLLCSSFKNGDSRLKKVLALPSRSQMKFMEAEVGAFIHFTTNTFNGIEHGDGSADPSIFNPRKLDIDQWMEAAKNIGAKYIVLTARHEDGFCLWPTKTTDYNITKSLYKGDLVKEFVEACRRHGMKPGLYFSPVYNGHEMFQKKDYPVKWGRDWDSITNLRLKDPAFAQKYKQLEIDQITELMTQYGPIFTIWMDHWASTDPVRQDICVSVTETIMKLQPNCVLVGPHVRHPGTERGVVTYPMWNAVNTSDGTLMSCPAKNKIDRSVPNEYGLLETDVITGHPLGKYWRNMEAPTDQLFSHGGWFWHKSLRKLPMDEQVEFYYRTVGLGANIIINLPPDQDGLIPEETLEATKVWGDKIKDLFHSGYIAESKGIKSGKEITLSWDKPCRINHFLLQEDVAKGQKVVGYQLEAFVDGKWVELSPANYLPFCPKGFNQSPGFETIGYKKIDRVEPIVTNKVRFKCTKAVTEPVLIKKFAVWNVE